MLANRIKVGALVALMLMAMELLAIAVIFRTPAAAHEAAPAVVTITPGSTGQAELSIATNLNDLLANLEGAGHDAFADLSQPDVQARLLADPNRLSQIIGLSSKSTRVETSLVGFDDTGNLSLRAELEASTSSLRIVPSSALGPILIRVSGRTSDDIVQTVFATPDGPGTIELVAVSASRPALDIVGEYTVSGFRHILPMGADHILFVIGLFLLSPAVRPLLVQVSLFTLAHTATLGLAAAGFISIPATIVEPLIAASIAFIAIENMFRSTLSRWRPAVVVAFGLLHGLGFASVLSTYGLPDGWFLLALASFNVGVEMGQLTVIAGCFLAVGFFSARPWYRSFVSIPASLCLAGIGLFWFVERLAEGMA